MSYLSQACRLRHYLPAPSERALPLHEVEAVSRRELSVQLYCKWMDCCWPRWRWVHTSRASYNTNFLPQDPPTEISSQDFPCQLCSPPPPDSREYHQTRYTFLALRSASPSYTRKPSPAPAKPCAPAARNALTSFPKIPVAGRKRCNSR